MNSVKGAWDVIVVGAGPAGATAARHCALKGLKVLLLEKERMPRFKPCAGGVNAAAVKALGFPLPVGVVERECKTVRIVYDGAERVLAEKKTITYMVTRSSFDSYLVALAEKAGAFVRQGEEALTLERGKRSVTVRTMSGSFKAPVLIGADGFFSRVRKALGFGFDEEETLFCVIADVPLGEEEVTKRFGDALTIHFGLMERGYGWLFPKKSHVSTGFGGEAHESKRLPALFEKFLGMYGLPRGLKMRGCFLPATKTRHRSFGERVLLAGDAAGFVDAFNGEGIRFAILSGECAATAVARCSEREDFSEKGLKEYEDLWYESFGHDLFSSKQVIEYIAAHKTLVFGIVIGNRGAFARYLKTLTGELRLGEYIAWLKRRFPLLLLASAPLVLKLWLRGKRKTRPVG